MFGLNGIYAEYIGVMINDGVVYNDGQSTNDIIIGIDWDANEETSHSEVSMDWWTREQLETGNRLVSPNLRAFRKISLQLSVGIHKSS